MAEALGLVFSPGRFMPLTFWIWGGGRSIHEKTIFWVSVQNKTRMDIFSLLTSCDEWHQLYMVHFFLTVRIVVISFDFIFFIGLQVIHKIVIFDFFKPLSSSKLFVLSQMVNDDGYRLYLLIISLNIVNMSWHREALGRFNDSIASASTTRLCYDHISSISSD